VPILFRYGRKNISDATAEKGERNRKPLTFLKKKISRGEKGNSLRMPQAPKGAAEKGEVLLVRPLY